MARRAKENDDGRVDYPTIAFRVSPERRDLMARYCRATGQSISELMISLLDRNVPHMTRTLQERGELAVESLLHALGGGQAAEAIVTAIAQGDVAGVTVVGDALKEAIKIYRRTSKEEKPDEQAEEERDEPKASKSKAKRPR